MHCCCLDKSVHRHPSLFFPHLPFQALFQARRRCHSRLGALRKNFPTTFSLPMKDTGGSRQEVSPKSAGSTWLCVRVLLFRSMVGWRQLHHPHHQRSKAGVEWVAQAARRKAWGGLGSKKPGLKVRMEKTISICFPGMEDEHKEP